MALGGFAQYHGGAQGRYRSGYGSGNSFVEIIDTHWIHRGAKYHFATHRLRTVGGQILEREFVDHPGSVVLIPVLPDQRLALIRVYRHAVDRTLLELPAGTCGPDEPFEVTANRELIEETGYQAGHWRKLREFFPVPGMSNERMALYQAGDLTAVGARPEVDEQIEVEPTSLDDALARIEDGTIQDAKSIVGLWQWALEVGYFRRPTSSRTQE